MDARSTSGAQANLKAYRMATQETYPIVLRSTPDSLSQADSVPNTSSSGRPAENPRNSMATTLGRVYRASDCRHVGFA